MKNICIGLVMVLACAGAAASEYVVEDAGVGLTYAELEYLVRQWTPQMREVAAKDAGDRLELEGSGGNWTWPVRARPGHPTGVAAQSTRRR